MCWSQLAVAQDVRSALYLYAQRGNVRSIRAMQRQGYSLEMMDANGNTPICEAALKGDQHTVNVLAAMGANPTPDCWNHLPPRIARQMRPQPMVAHVMTGESVNIPATQTTGYTPVYVNQTTGAEASSATIMTQKAPVYAPTNVSPPDTFPAGWTATALLGVGAGTALLFGTLNKGGGSSSDKKDPYNATPVEKNDCTGYLLSSEPENADFISCVRDDGVVKFKIVGCKPEYIMVYNDGSASCAKTQCAGMPLTVCPKHGDCDSCDEVDGAKRFRLTSCETGYVMSGNVCEVVTEDELGEKYGVNGYTNMSTAKSSGSTPLYYPKQSVGTVYSSVYQNVYGIRDINNKQIHNSFTSSTDNATGRVITVEHKGRGNDYGMYSTNLAMNARTTDAARAVSGTINMKKTGNGNVVAISAKQAVNIYVLGTTNNSLESSATINMESLGDVTNTGDFRGLSGTAYAANAVKGGEYTQVAKGNITINHKGTGSVSAVSSKGTSSNQGYAYNALMVRSISNSNITDNPVDANYEGTMKGRVEGNININNIGNGTVIGVDAYRRAANAYKDVLNKTETAKWGNVTADITINNEGNGNVYGLKSTNGSAFNSLNRKGADSHGYITIEKNQGNGNVFGLAAKTVSYNAYYVVADHNNATDGDMKNMAKIIMGSETSSTDITPSNMLSGSGNVNAMYVDGAGAANGFLRTGKDTGAETTVIEGATINIYHTTPSEATKDSEIFIRGIFATANSYNSQAQINSIVKNATLTSQITIREKNDSDVEVRVRGADVRGTFVNAHYDYNSTESSGTPAATDKMKGVITGNIFINGTHGLGVVDVFGINATDSAYNAFATEHVTAGSVEGKVVVRSRTKAYGMVGGDDSTDIVANARSLIASTSTATTKGYIEVTGNWGLRGMSGGAVQYNAYGKNATGEINIIKGNEINPESDINGNVFGMVGTNLYNGHEGGTGTISVFSYGTQNAYGMYASKNIDSGTGTSTIIVTGIPKINSENKATGSFRGMASVGASADIKNRTNDKITINFIGAKFKAEGDSTASNSSEPSGGDLSTAIGIYGGKSVNIYNQGKINITREVATTTKNKETSSPTSTTWTPTGNYTGGTAYGIYSEGGGRIENSGTIEVTNKIANSYGIYVKDGTNSTIINTKTITIGSAAGYGIYIESNCSPEKGCSVSNSGTIQVGSATTGDHVIHTASVEKNMGIDSFDHFIHLGGAAFNNNSLVSSIVPIDFDAMDGQMNIGTGGTYEAPALSGTLSVQNDVITNGFEDSYTLNDALKTEDMTGLHVASSSALFDATTNDVGDITMTRKDFQNFTDNNSMAGFLEKNYALKQNENLFTALKKVGSANALRRNIAALSGQKMFGRLNFEDLSMMRELSANMNHQLFNNKTEKLSIVQNVDQMNFKGSNSAHIKYSLMNKKVDNKSLGLAIAFTDIASADNQNTNKRKQTSYQMIVPLGYKTKKMHFMMTPRLGYAQAKYDRAGLNNASYDGVIEKRLYGVGNEARYEVNVGDWKLFPTAEFNVLGYQQKGRETKKQFSLNIPTQNTISVEGGIGFHASHETELAHGTLNLNAGVMAYHEFANPYEMRLQMQGMRGSFTVHDEDQSVNRMMFNAGFSYDKEDVTLYGDAMTELRDELNAKVRTGVKVQF